MEEEEGGQGGCGGLSKADSGRNWSDRAGQDHANLGGHGEELAFYSWCGGKPWKVLNIRIVLLRICFNSDSKMERKKK